MINPVFLRSFCSLVELGHFTRTAEHLHMTQSGVSQHVRKLEEYLECELLIREGKHFSLTDAGERLYHEAQQIILSLENLTNRVTEDSAYEGLVRVMSPGSVGLKLYPHLLELQEQHPSLIIDYRFAPNKDIEKAISEFEVDIGLMTRRSTLERVSCTAIAEEPLLLVTPSSVSEPSWDQLVEIGFINHPDGAHHAGLLLGANYSEFEHSDRFTQKGFSNQISLILEPISMGIGFTVLPAYAVSAFHKQERVRAHTLSNPVSENIYLGTNLRRTLPSRVNTVIEEVKRGL